MKKTISRRGDVIKPGQTIYLLADNLAVLYDPMRGTLTQGEFTRGFDRRMTVVDVGGSYPTPGFGDLPAPQHIIVKRTNDVMAKLDDKLVFVHHDFVTVLNAEFVEAQNQVAVLEERLKIAKEKVRFLAK